MWIRSCFAIGLALIAAPASAQVKSGQEAWGPSPAGLPAGAQAAVLAGDPMKAGLFIIRVKFPAGYTVPPHFHPTGENVTVLSGDVAIGMGDKVSQASDAKLQAGDFISLKPGMHHYAVSRGGGVIQISSEGPFTITYVNPADDPRRKK
jgi:quercetin dioxygenase-like cupin family protein